ncbi:MAG: hypothetical protein ACPG8V_01775 [Alphaproteobacteria bacterium]
MNKKILLLSLLTLTTGCVKIPASWVSDSMVDRGNQSQAQSQRQMSSQDYIRNSNNQQNNTYQVSQVETNNQSTDKWSGTVYTNANTNSNYGKSGNSQQSGAYANNNAFNLNQLSAQQNQQNNVCIPPKQTLANAGTNQVENINSFGTETAQAQAKPSVKMLYPFDGRRRVPTGQNRNSKVSLNTKKLLGKDINFLVSNLGTPNKSLQQNSFYIWQYFTKAEGLECTLDLTIKNNQVRHVALLGPINNKTQQKCFANIVRYNMEVKK